MYELAIGVPRASRKARLTLPALRKLLVPRVTRVELRGFSVYALNKNVDIDIGSGATCLAGANGLGKSTFLAAIIYGLTGSIPDTEGSKSRSLHEYRRDATAYAKQYFAGRINDKDREKASVALDLEIGPHTVRIERPIFRDKPDLSWFSVRQTAGRKLTVIPNARAAGGDVRLSGYESFVTANVGLESFDQVVFLHHAVLAFDEQRHLLFWDSRQTELALFLIFGGNEEATAADKLRRQIDRADSRARNLQFDATKLQQRIGDLQAAFGLDGAQNEDVDLKSKVESLLHERAKVDNQLDLLHAAVGESMIRLADRAARLVSLRDQYNRRFQELLAGQAEPSSNPIVVSSIADARCGVCGTVGEAVMRTIERRLASQHCPLCDSVLADRLRNPSFAELATLDKEMAETQDDYGVAAEASRRTGHERDEYTRRRLELDSKLDAFEKSNRDIVSRLRSQFGGAPQDQEQISLQALRQDLERLYNEKAVALADRDQRKAELGKLQTDLSEKYTAAEVHFVPIFRELSELFLGRPIAVKLRRTPAGMSLLIDVDGTQRRQPFQLSESQRFFVDLALRMALAQYMSADEGRAPLYIDTPEGALDIAYEQQAGAMFGRFVEQGHDLLMTANINSSQLLLELASRCGPKHFHLVQMTAWSKLSTVQEKAQPLFEAAIKTITAALKSRA